jgi:hypothetical protein
VEKHTCIVIDMVRFSAKVQILLHYCKYYASKYLYCNNFVQIDKDKDGISINQKWNSTIQKNAQNIKECGFPVDVSSIKLCQSGSSKFL